MSDRNNKKPDESGKKNRMEDYPDDLRAIDLILSEELTAPEEVPENIPDEVSEDSPGVVDPAIDPAESSARDKIQGSRSPPADNEALLEEIRKLGGRIDALAAHFEGKIKYDEHKNRIIDDLHGELHNFREGIIRKHMFSMVGDIIKIIDDARRFRSHYENAPPTEEGCDRLLEFIGQIPTELEDLFTVQGIYPFTCSRNTFDPAKQRIIRKHETGDPEKHGQVAERLRPGYEWEGKVIRPEMISIYVCNDQPNNRTEES